MLQEKDNQKGTKRFNDDDVAKFGELKEHETLTSSCHENVLTDFRLT